MAGMFDNFKAIAGNVAATAGKAAEQAVEKGRTALDKAALEKRLKTTQQKLGEAYYEYATYGNGDKKQLDNYVKQIDFLLKALESPSDSYSTEELNVHLCGSCGAEVSEDAMFCGGCGESFT